MKPLLVRALFLLLCLLGFTGYVVVSSGDLPSRVATHFDAQGNPNGWMSRDGHIRFMLGFGWLFPLFMWGVFFAIRFLPSGLVNMPNREYWLSPERRAITCDWLLLHGFWLSVLSVGFCGGMHSLVIQAARSPSGQFPNSMLLGLAVTFLFGIVLWVVAMVRRFRLPS